jgi:hypothetical protein
LFRERERKREMKTWKSRRKWKTRKKWEILLFGGGGEKDYHFFWRVPWLCPLVFLLGKRNVRMVPRCGLNK